MTGQLNKNKTTNIH